MRFAAATLLALVLAAGPGVAQESAPDPIADKIAEAAAAQAKPAKPARRGRDATRPPVPASSTPSPNAAVLTLAALRGRAPADVRAKLGAPSVEREEGLGALWTYRLPDCALLVFFADRGGLTVVGAEAGPLVRGGPVPTVDACLAGASPA